MDIIKIIKSKTSWGRKQVVEIHPIYGVLLADHMKSIDKTNISTDVVIDSLFILVANRCNYTYYNEFIDIVLSQNKTMMGKDKVNELITKFIYASEDDHESLTTVMAEVSNSLLSNNSYKVIIMSFKEQFIILNTGD